MKIFKNNSILIRGFMMVICFAFFTACEEGPNFRIQEYPEQSVTDFSPSAARPTEELTINGSNFGVLKGAVTVFFNGATTVQTDIVSVTDNKIVVKVPSNAISGKISLKVWGFTKEIPGDFTFIPGGVVTTVSPQFGVEGALVTIDGKNFGTDPNMIKVSFGGINGSIVSVTDTQIKVTIPAGGITGMLTVTIGNQKVDGVYFLVGEEKLAGTIVGTPGSWANNPATTIAAAFDGNITTFVDGLTASGYLGYDLGATVKATIKRIRYYPRATLAARLAGAKLYGTNDLNKVGTTNGDLLFTIPTTPLPAYSWNEAAITSTTSYRYVYLYFTTGNMNINELEIYGKKD